MWPWCEGYTDCRLAVKTQASKDHSADGSSEEDAEGGDDAERDVDAESESDQEAAP